MHTKEALDSLNATIEALSIGTFMLAWAKSGHFPRIKNTTYGIMAWEASLMDPDTHERIGGTASRPSTAIAECLTRFREREGAAK